LTGGGSATNFVGYPSGQGWTIGGGSATNYTALPPGWSAGGGSATNFVAVPPGWVVGGGSFADIVIYAFLNVRAAAPHRVEAPAGEW